MENFTATIVEEVIEASIVEDVFSVTVTGGLQGAQGDKGDQGIQGDTGATGEGVIVGGDANQALTKIDGTDFNTQWSTIDQTFVGLPNVDNTSDANKPVSVAVQSELDTLTSAVSLNTAKRSYPVGDESKLNGIEIGAEVNTINSGDDVSLLLNDAGYITSAPVTSVAGKDGVVTLDKGDVGLSSVDNTSDLDKPVSTAQQTALNLKANLLSANFTELLLAGLPVAAYTKGSNAWGNYHILWDKDGNELVVFQYISTEISVPNNTDVPLPINMPDENYFSAFVLQPTNSTVSQDTTLKTVSTMRVRIFSAASGSAVTRNLTWFAFWSKT